MEQLRIARYAPGDERGINLLMSGIPANEVGRLNFAQEKFSSTEIKE